MNAQTEMMNASVTKLKKTVEEEFFNQSAWPTIKEYNYEDLKKEIINAGHDGRAVKMFSDVKGFAELTKKEIKKLKNFNLVIVGIRGKIY